MKKILLFVLGIILFLPSVYAGTAYVDNIDIAATINTDGSMTVVETINWDIEEELNGLYRDFVISNPQNPMNSASGIVIDSVKVNDKEFNYAYNTLKNGDDLKYNINNITGGKQVKIFTPSEDEEKITKITYTLYDVVIKYNDIAELYWNFIGDGWEYGIDNVNISITLPGNSKTLKVFGHGPLNGVSNIMENNCVTLNVSGLRSNEEVDARLLFDTTLVDTTKIIYVNRLESILAQEKVLAEEANLRRETVKKAFIASIVIAIIGVTLPIVIYFKERKKVSQVEFKGKYYRELVEDYGPTVMNKVLYPSSGLYESYNMLATMLDLVRKKYIKIEPVYKNNNKKPHDYNLKLINDNIEELNEIEQYFVKELVFVDTNEITLKELTKKNTKTTKAHEKAIEAFGEWSKITTKVAKEKELLEEKAKGNTKPILICVFCVLLLVAVIAMGVIINDDIIILVGMIGIFIGIFELVFIGIGLTDLKSRTDKGREHNVMWKAFRKYLLDFSKLDEHDYKSLVIWEHYLVYAAALGIAKQVIKELKIVFPNEFNDGTNMFTSYATIGLLSDNSFNSFSSSFTTATGTSFSSSSGSGGGFSGGAGGRWRRWRRRWFLKTIQELKQI